MSVDDDKDHLKRKNQILDQGKIDRARELLRAATETEAISPALDAVSELARFRAETDSGLDELLGLGGFADPWAGSLQEIAP